MQPTAMDLEETYAPSIVVPVDDDVAQVMTPSAQPAMADVKSPLASLQSFIDSMKLPLKEPLITSSPL